MNACRRATSVKLNRISQSPRRSVAIVGLMAFLSSASVGLVTGIHEPAVNDEFSYLLAADTFVHGRVTNPTHPMWTHFETFHVIQQPTYMSKYPPAQGLVLAAGQLAGHPIVGVWFSFGLMCAAICWMLYAWVPPRWALLGGIFALINPTLGFAGYWAQSYWGGAVAATGGALVIGGVRRLMRRPRVLHSFLTAAGLAILANSRPYEGLLISLPAGLMLLFWMSSKRGPALWASGYKIVLPMVIVLTLTATAMGLYNLRATGEAFRLPYQVYEQTYTIAPIFLLQDLNPEPAYRHEVMRDFHRGVGLTFYSLQHSIMGFLVKNIVFLIWWAIYSLNIFAAPLIVTWRAAAKWLWKDPWSRFVLLTYGLVTCGQFVQTYIMVHYLAPASALNYIYVLQAVRFWRWRQRNKKVRQIGSWLVSAAGLVTLVGTLYAHVSSNHPSAWHQQRAGILRQFNGAEGKHLIIVSYGPEHSPHQEWVHNGADIDAAKVVWARQMSPREDCQLVKYFTGRQIWTLKVDDKRKGPELKPQPKDLCA